MKGRLTRWLSADAVPAALATMSTARTHVGRVRTINEDRLLDRGDRGCWAIADGMGGHSAGDAAASTAIATLSAMVDEGGGITRARVDEVLQETSRAIASERADGGQSGTTVVVAWLDDGLLTVTWAGDSRAYLIRDGASRLLTRDHSIVQELVDAGLVKTCDAAHHPRAHVITRALGVERTIALETMSVAVRPGDRLLLCTDGLSRSLVDDDLAATEPMESMADRLLANALDRDGADNISLVLAQMTPPVAQAAANAAAA